MCLCVCTSWYADRYTVEIRTRHLVRPQTMTVPFVLNYDWFMSIIFFVVISSLGCLERRYISLSKTKGKTVRENADYDILTKLYFPRAYREESRELDTSLIIVRANSSQQLGKRETSSWRGLGNSSTEGL